MSKELKITPQRIRRFCRAVGGVESCSQCPSSNKECKKYRRESLFPYIREFLDKDSELISCLDDSVKDDIVGKRFGRLVVVEKVGTDKWRRLHVLCKCDCGNEKLVFASNLRQGQTKSCGCLRAENMKKVRKR